jgi:hypothetical protein
MDNQTIVSLPMYDGLIPTSDTDLFWSLFCKHSELETPPQLNRTISCRDAWTSGTNLMISQSCGYPVVKKYNDYVKLVGTPIYAAEGCSGPHYSSAIIASSNTKSLYDILTTGSVTIAINSFDSFSGWLLLLSAIADCMSGTDIDMQHIISKIIVTGAHVQSMAAVRDGIADIAAIDCVTLALTKKHCSHLAEGLYTIGWSQPAPALPYITHIDASHDFVQSLRSALKNALSDCSDPSYSAARGAMLLTDIEVSGEISMEVYEAAIEGHLERAVRVCPSVLDVISDSPAHIGEIGVEVVVI